MATTTQRRKRFKQQPLGKIASYGRATTAVLNQLQFDRYSNTDFLAAVTGHSPKYIRRFVMPTLFNEGYVCLAPQSTFCLDPNNRGRFVALDKEGIERLKYLGIWRNPTWHKQPFPHEINGILSRQSFKIAARQNPHLIFLDGPTILNSRRVPESTRTAEHPFRIKLPSGRTLIPDDDLHGYKYELPGSQARYLFWFREDDRHTEDVATIRNKLKNYLEFYKENLFKTLYGIPDIYFCFLTIDHPWRKIIMGELEKLTKGEARAHFLFKVQADFYTKIPPATGHMASEDWYRVGYPPFNILKEMGVVK